MYLYNIRIINFFFLFSWSDVNLKELKDVVGFSGFRQMALKYGGFGLKEMLRSAIIPLQVMQIQKYIQDITTADVEKGPSGVRAQAMGKDGKYFYVELNYYFCIRLKKLAAYLPFPNFSTLYS